MTQENKRKIEFAPGCFDNFDGTQEELDNLVEFLTKMVESGELDEISEPLTDEIIADMDEQEQQILLRQLEGMNDERKNSLN